MFTNCPECSDLAEILDRFVLESTDGLIEHVKIACIAGHRFTLPVDMLDR